MADVPGTSGDDTLYGTSEADTITGLGGNDVLVGFGGADSLDGGDGIDSAFYFDSAAGVGVNLTTGAGNGGSAEGDTLVSIETLWGSGYNDSFIGNDADNSLYGLDGNDILKGGGGADSLDGGSGDDILKGGGGADHFEGGTGIDTVDYSDSPSSGGTGIYGVSVDLYPGDFPGHGVGADAQDDTYSGIENITGSAYEDSLTGTDEANVLKGLDGNDSLNGYGANDTLDGGDGDDNLTGGGGDDLLRGGAGADALNGDGNNDLGDYSDTVDYSDKTLDVAVTLNTFIVVDVTVGGVVEDKIRNFENVIGGAGNDALVGDYFANVLNGGAGNDTLSGDLGIDRAIGGAGDDIIYVDNVGDVVIENAAEGIDLVKSSVSFTLGANLEKLQLSGSAAINGTGNSLNNIMNGNSGNNLLDGNGGADLMAGALGDDTYVVDNIGDEVKEKASGGTDLVKSAISFTLGANVEKLQLTGSAAIDAIGNSLNNVMNGNSGNNVLDGNGGADIMAGALGDDTYVVDNVGDEVKENASAGIDLVKTTISFALGGNLEKLQLLGSAALNGTGNGLNNVLNGNSGNNVLDGMGSGDTIGGNGGDDTVIGGGGSDQLSGGSGADKFVFDAALGSSNMDRISDFTAVDDTIVLDRTVFSGIAATGTLDAAAFFAGTAAHDADDRIIYDSATGKLFYDADGDGAGAQVQFALLSPATALTDADFFVVG